MKSVRHFFETQLVRFGAWLLPRLPLHGVRLLADLVGSLAFLIDYRGRDTALENLRAAFGSRFTFAQRFSIAHRSYRTFAGTFLGLFWSVRLTEQTWRDYVTVTPASQADDDAARASGSIWVTPHYGNFEIIGLSWGFRGFPLQVIAQDFKNPGLTAIFKQLREQSGHDVIPQRQAMVRLFKALKNGGHCALLTDLTIKPSRAATVIRCFGLQTCVTTLHVQLAQRLSLPLFPTLCQPSSDSDHTEAQILGVLRPQPGDALTPPTQAIWDHFEPFIHQHPERWMWMYKHWRYLPPDAPAQNYPAYANPNKAFNRLLDQLP
ncbi:MAG: lysophospholipid acyltransferase family protein [Verrucomicrobiales bacterium]|nr:lysophospholipid acyltransferase family protein [Verrucomicrobiales bacterium]